MDEIIHGFKGEYDFLSNNYISPVIYNGITFPCAEAAYQAQKCPSRAMDFTAVTAVQAINLGHRVALMPNWIEMRDNIMQEILMLKFTQNKWIAQKLLDTRNIPLVFENTWHQNYWGYCTCRQCVMVRKYNRLGELLQKVRGELEWQKQE